MREPDSARLHNVRQMTAVNGEVLTFEAVDVTSLGDIRTGEVLESKLSA